MEKIQEMFTKDQEEQKNKEIEVNSTLDGINSRITEGEKPQVKWPKRQNGGNYCWKTEYRKKDEKKNAGRPLG